MKKHITNPKEWIERDKVLRVLNRLKADHKLSGDSISRMANVSRAMVSNVRGGYVLSVSRDNFRKIKGLLRSLNAGELLPIRKLPKKDAQRFEEKLRESLSMTRSQELLMRKIDKLLKTINTVLLFAFTVGFLYAVHLVVKAYMNS